MAPTLEGPKRVNVYLPEALVAAVKDLAAHNSMSMSEVVRVALWEYVIRAHPDVGLNIGDLGQWQDSWESRVHSLTQELLSVMSRVVSDEDEDDGLHPFATKAE